MKRFYPYNMVVLMACLVIGLFVFHRVSTSQTRIPAPESSTAPEMTTEINRPTAPVPTLPEETTTREMTTTAEPTTEEPTTNRPGAPELTTVQNETTGGEETEEPTEESTEETTEEETTPSTQYVPPTQNTYRPPTQPRPTNPPTVPFITTVPIATAEDYDFRGLVIVKYMTTEGEILEEYSVKDLFETPYETDEKAFDGYHFVGMNDGSAPASGVIQKGELYVIYVYEKISQPKPTEPMKEPETDPEAKPETEPWYEEESKGNTPPAPIPFQNTPPETGDRNILPFYILLFIGTLGTMLLLIRGKDWEG